MQIRQFCTIILLAATLIGCGGKQHFSYSKAPSSRYARSAHINVQLGLGYLQKGQTARAKKKLLLALQQAPRIAEVHDAMAYFLAATGEKNEADKYYRRAIQLAPGKGASLNNYGAFLCREGKYKQADRYFRLAIKDKFYVNLADAYENAGLCSLQVPNFKRAEYYLEQALAKDPARPNSLLELAEIAYRKGLNQRAESHLERYRALTQATPQSLYLHYRVASRLHKHAASQRYASQLLKRYPNSAQARLYQFRKGYHAP
jgi:type IV pilus assembly protein PilF